MARAFVIRPFGKKQDSAGKELDFDRVHEELITPALLANGLEGGTTGDIVDAGNIREDMFALIFEADLVVCDVTILNANVFYELGIRHALRKRRTVMIKGHPTQDATPFDLLTDRYLPYAVDDPASTLQELTDVISATMASNRETDSPIFQMLPSLPEADPATVLVVPLTFSEEVERARSARSMGWLRLLSEDVRGLRFQWQGLRLVAQAQWALRDFEGARKSWEAIREVYPKDIGANLALANIYERLHRSNGRSAWLRASDQRILQVSEQSEATTEQRVEALSLGGRNQKTRWRREFESHESEGERRAAAMNPSLHESYEAYREAFDHDLDHFYSGLNALQMGTLFLELSAGDDDWKDVFDDDETAETYRRKLSRDVENLRTVVPVSVDAALRRMDRNDSGRIWAEISRADVLFLLEDRERRIRNAYLRAIPAGAAFAWGATRGQLELFAELGFKTEVAHRLIAALDEHVGMKASMDHENEADEAVHVVFFAGHKVDLPGRETPRFPPGSEPKARELIRAALEARRADGGRLEALASATPGSDVLFHEVCAELGVPSTLCLPMPAQDFARKLFAEFDDWRTRFFQLVEQHCVLELSDRPGLPKWLHGAELDPWERTNRWVMEMARTSPQVRKVTLIALWDGADQGDRRGGTSHMVELARASGAVYVEIVDAGLLAP